MKLGLVATSMLLLSASAASGAEDPTPSSCRVSTILVCPGGDLSIRVLVRRGHVPLSRTLVTLDLGTCSEVKLAGAIAADSQTVVDGMRLTRASGTDGQVVFRARAGGAFSCPRVTVLAGGVLIAERSAVASPDQNGDLVVNQTDLDLLRHKIGTKDPTGDLDGDGQVSEADVQIAAAHLGHHAELVTPTHVTTWGEIKAGYR